jgi:hypothetical protein
MAGGHFGQALPSAGRVKNLVAIGLKADTEQPAKLHLIVYDNDDRFQGFIFHFGPPYRHERPHLAAMLATLSIGIGRQRCSFP